METPDQGLPEGVVEGELVATSPTSALPAPRVDTRRRDALAFDWLNSHANDSRHTRDRYRRDVTGWKAEADGTPIPGEVHPGPSFFYWLDAQGFDTFAIPPLVIDRYRTWLQGDEHAGRYAGQTRLAPSTVAGKLNALSSFYHYCQRNDPNTCRWNPAEHTKRPKVGRRSRTSGLTRTELDAIRAEALRQGLREYALVQLLAGTGLRVSEALNADTSDLVHEHGAWYLHVIRKGSDEEVPVQVPDGAARAVRRYVRGRQGPIFRDEQGRRMTPEVARYYVEKIARKAGVIGPKRAGGRKISPHSFRHTATTEALNAGVSLSDVAALMGHTSMETTARYDRAIRERNNPAALALAALVSDDLPDVE